MIFSSIILMIVIIVIILTFSFESFLRICHNCNLWMYVFNLWVFNSSMLFECFPRYKHFMITYWTTKIFVSK
eukprot:UN19462